jgi:Xaa-Pro aminopeptidase
MWTDGRYYIQAEKELYPTWEMRKMERGQQDLKSYIKDTFEKDSKVGIDMNMISNENFENINKVLSKKGVLLVHDQENIIDKIWSSYCKPSYSDEQVIIHELTYAGQSPLEKFKRVKEILQQEKQVWDKIKSRNFAILIVRLDDIAWLTNLRGKDIAYNPVFFSFAILYFNQEKEEEFLHLFTNKQKFDSEEIRTHLSENKIQLFDYKEIYNHLNLNLPSEDLKSYFLIGDKTSLNQNLFNLVKDNYKEDDYKIIEKDIVEYTKGTKTQREIQGFRDCNIRDGAALVKYFAWLEDQLMNKNTTDLNEYQAALQSANFRGEMDKFMGESFEAISATGSNAAIIHYKPDEKSSTIINKENIYLLDSGGQYLDGTTDTTRTLHFFNPSDKEKEMYTRVLLGNLSIERSKILKRWNYNGGNIDALARQYLWQVGCEYLHGTGHGVGYFLNVHEGPHGIGGYTPNPPLVPGMVVTNEPGYYLKDQFGIRIENMLVVTETGDSKEFIAFENLTIVPYERNLLDYKLLSDDFIDYINQYHREVYEKLSPLLKDDQLAIDYLKRKTEKIARP